VIILCAALLPFALGAWYLLGNDEEAADTSAPKIAQSGDTICDQFLATMPDDLSDRKKAGKVMNMPFMHETTLIRMTWTS